jgi:hypothetical protein
MRFRLRLGATLAIVVGAVLLVGLVAAPALAWHSTISVKTSCVGGQVHVAYTVTSSRQGDEATVKVRVFLSHQLVHQQTGSFGSGQNSFSDEFDLPAGSTGTLVVVASATWTSGEQSNDKATTELPGDCGGKTTTTSCGGKTTTTICSGKTTTTTEETTTTEAPGTTAPSTTVAGATTTAGRGALPFTGANSMPLLLAGLGLVVGGLVILVVSRSRAAGRQAR